MGGNERVFPEWVSSTPAIKFPMKTDQQMCWDKGREGGKEVYGGLFTKLEIWGQRCSRQTFCIGNTTNFSSVQLFKLITLCEFKIV